MADDRRIDTSDRPAADEHQKMETLQVEMAELRAQMRESQNDKAVAVVQKEPPVAMALPVMSIQELKDRDSFIKQVINEFFEEGVHYGVPFPDAKDKDGKPIRMLYKVGAEWFASAFGVRPEPIPLVDTVERGDKPFVFYRYRCNLVLVRTGQIVGSAEGECSSEEDKYKYRLDKYKCPTCGMETIGPDRFAQNGGWACYKKNGGCGAKYGKNEASIMNQPKPGRHLNPEVVGLSHTIASMALKRAFVAAVRSAFGLSAYIKYFEGLDDVGDDEDDKPPKIINGQPIPKRTAEHNERIKREQEAQPAPAVKPSETLSGQEAVNSPTDPDLVSEHPLPLPAHHTTQTGKNGDGEKKYKLALWKRSLAVFGMADGLMRKTISELPDGINWGMIIYTRAQETLGYRDEEHVKDTLGVASLKEWETTLGELMCILVENAPTPDGVPEPAQA